MMLAGADAVEVGTATFATRAPRPGCWPDCRRWCRWHDVGDVRASWAPCTACRRPRPDAPVVDARADAASRAAAGHGHRRRGLDVATAGPPPSATAAPERTGTGHPSVPGRDATGRAVAAPPCPRRRVPGQPGATMAEASPGPAGPGPRRRRPGGGLAPGASAPSLVRGGEGGPRAVRGGRSRGRLGPRAPRATGSSST